jgi:hypothetical protein
MNRAPAFLLRMVLIRPVPGGTGGARTLLPMRAISPVAGSRGPFGYRS